MTPLARYTAYRQEWQLVMPDGRVSGAGHSLHVNSIQLKRMKEEAMGFAVAGLPKEEPRGDECRVEVKARLFAKILASRSGLRVR